MFGRRMFGGAFWGAAYFGDGGDLEPILALGDLFIVEPEVTYFVVEPEVTYFVVP